MNNLILKVSITATVVLLFTAVLMAPYFRKSAIACAGTSILIYLVTAVWAIWTV